MFLSGSRVLAYSAGYVAPSVLTIIQAPSFLTSFTTAAGLILAAVWVGRLHLRLLAENKLFRTQLADANGKEQAAQKASEAVNEFLTRITHEMRTPMEGLINFAALALKTDLTPLQREYLDRVLGSAEWLTHVVHDVLDFTRMESSQLELECKNFSFANCLASAVRFVQSAASQKNLDLTCRLDPQIPGQLRGDSNRLHQVVVNLLQNAIRYTTAGSVVLSASLASDDVETVTVSVAIADTGIGIPLEDQARIFEPFQIGSNTQGTAAGGTGLGLSICRRLIHLMQGEIELQSQIGAGSTFRFTATFGKPAPEKDYVETADVLQRLALKRLAILLADEDSASRRFVTKLLESAGHQISPVASAGAALTVFATDIFDVVFLSTTLPDMKALPLAHSLRKLEDETTRTQLYILPAENDVTPAEAYLAAGLDGVATRPIQVENLHLLLNKAFEAKDAVELGR